MQKFSVLMSIYHKEKPEYARQCFESLIAQTAPATEWVIVEDGELTPKLYALLDEYQAKYPSLIRRVRLKTNKGLGLALREGIKRCSFELVARMDTDDIAVKNRFEQQLKMFENYPELDICSGHIKEFETTPDNIVSSRKVPVTERDIEKFSKLRDSFNHMAVMYKKSAVLKAGNYPHAPLMEDSVLWAKMLVNGSKALNIDDYLVYVRAGSDMLQRRGGLSYLKKYALGRKKIYKTGYISLFDYYFTVAAQFAVALIPTIARKWVYATFLRD